MSVFNLHKEKTDIDDLVKRAQEYVDSAGKLYAGVDLGKCPGKEDRVLLASVTMKLKAGELLKAELDQKTVEADQKQTKMMLDQLAVIVSKEMNELKRLQIALSDLDMAKREERVIDEAQAVRKLQLGVEEYAGKRIADS